MTNVYSEMRFAKDECYTSKCESEKLVNYINTYISKNNIIWLPFDNELSNIYKELDKKGYKCVLSNLELGLDFYHYEPEKWDIIITNPPFSKRTQLMKRLLKFGKPFIILQGTQFFNNQQATKALCEHIFEFILPEKRMNFLTYNADLDCVKSIKNENAFYSFWLCYGIGLPKTFNLLKNNGNESKIEQYSIDGNAIVDNHLTLFNVNKEK